VAAVHLRELETLALVELAQEMEQKLALAITPFLMAQAVAVQDQILGELVKRER
jgi:hypothetical protein